MKSLADLIYSSTLSSVLSYTVNSRLSAIPYSILGCSYICTRIKFETILLSNYTLIYLNLFLLFSSSTGRTMLHVAWKAGTGQIPSSFECSIRFDSCESTRRGAIFVTSLWSCSYVTHTISVFRFWPWCYVITYFCFIVYILNWRGNVSANLSADFCPPCQTHVSMHNQPGFPCYLLYRQY